MCRALLTCCAALLIAACSTQQPQTSPQTSALIPCRGDVTGSLIPQRALCVHGESGMSIADSWQAYERLLGPTGRPMAR